MRSLDLRPVGSGLGLVESEREGKENRDYPVGYEKSFVEKTH